MEKKMVSRATLTIYAPHHKPERTNVPRNKVSSEVYLQPPWGVVPGVPGVPGVLVVPGGPVVVSPDDFAYISKLSRFLSFAKLSNISYLPDGQIWQETWDIHKNQTNIMMMMGEIRIMVVRGAMLCHYWLQKQLNGRQTLVARIARQANSSL